jgi:hypothetical protein
VSQSRTHFKPSRLAEYSESAIIAEIQRVIRDEFGGIVPTRDQFESRSRVSHPTIARWFGTYRAGIRAAGFAVHKQLPRPKISKEEVLTNLREVLRRADGERFSQEFYRKNGGAYCEEVVKDRLGVNSWDSVLTALGAAKRPRIVHTVVSARARRRRELANATKQEAFEEVGRIWALNGRRPSYGEFVRQSRLGISVFRKWYASWTEAVEAFCKERNIFEQGLRRARPTKQILVNELRAFQTKRPGQVLKYHAYKAAGGTFDRTTFVRRFGSWTAAVNAAGGVSGEQARHSKDDLFNELQRLWERLGRQPKQVEMSKSGKISPKCYARMFGSWTKAVHAFCADRNGDPPSATAAVMVVNDAGLGQQSATIAAVDASPRTESVTACIIAHTTGRTVSNKMRFQVMKRDASTCKVCGRSPALSPGLQLHVDHVDPYSRGGETTLDNLRTLCRDCNVGKSNL